VSGKKRDPNVIVIFSMKLRLF